MTTARRIWVAAGVLGAALLVQAGLYAHMMFGPSNVYPELKKPLADLPLEFDVERPDQPPLIWGFKTPTAEADTRKKLPFDPLGMILRRGRAPELNVDAECYIVYSENGEDRKHHPGICWVDVHQIPEDVSGREVIFLGGDKKRPVQRFCFQTSPTRTETVYYWHYTIEPVEQPGQTKLQQIYQTHRRTPPSITVQVSTSAGRERWPLVERDLIAALDQKLRSDHLPDGVRMGCDRLSIGIVTN